MQDTVTEAKAEFTRAKERLARALTTTPDDRINWSPSPTSRTPVQQVAHAAMAITGIHGMMLGKEFPFANTAEMDASSLAAEKEYTSREQVLGFLEKNSSEFLAWLDTLTPEQLASTFEMPFGSFPMTSAITFPADHTHYARNMEAPSWCGHST